MTHGEPEVPHDQFATTWIIKKLPNAKFPSRSVSRRFRHHYAIAEENPLTASFLVPVRGSGHSTTQTIAAIYSKSQPLRRLPNTPLPLPKCHFFAILPPSEIC